MLKNSLDDKNDLEYCSSWHAKIA